MEQFLIIKQKLLDLAEINRDFLKSHLTEKEYLIFKEISFQLLLLVVKENDYHGVDGISGGTITSDGVTAMLKERLDKYLPYLKTR